MFGKKKQNRIQEIEDAIYGLEDNIPDQSNDQEFAQWQEKLVNLRAELNTERAFQKGLEDGEIVQVYVIVRIQVGILTA